MAAMKFAESGGHGRLQGKIVRWLPDKGFGFVQDQAGIQYFFHRSAVDGNPDDVKVAASVTFTPVTSPKGPRAESVTLGD